MIQEHRNRGHGAAPSSLRDAVAQATTPALTRTRIIDRYKQYIDPLHMGRPMESPGEPRDECPECKARGSIVVESSDSTVQCRACGYCRYEPVLQSAPSYRINRTARPTMTLYKRINHFNDWMSQFQAKESITVPDEVYATIVKEIYRTKTPSGRQREITAKSLRGILRKLKFNKYYEHIPRIMHRLQGTRPPTITQEVEDRMRFMFREIQEPFMRHSPKTRKNFLSYSFVLRKFVGLLGLNELKGHFPLLKSRAKLYAQDLVWRRICADLGWRFEPSI